MNKEDYFKYYIQGSDHYLIPKDVFKELFNEMVNWRKESKELNQKYLNAVADYEQEKFNVEELKKQIEEKENIACNWKDSCLENAGKIEKLETQQKEFIKYLENGIDICDGFLDTVKSDLQEIPYGVISAGKTYIITRIKENEITHKVYEEILKKYKEIIGGKE